MGAYLSSLGYPVYLPLRASPRADLVYLTPKAIRAQVKTATISTQGNATFEQCRLISRGHGPVPSSKPFTAEEIDELWVVGTHLWKFPVEVIEGRTSLSLRATRVSKDYNPDHFIEAAGSAEYPYRDRLFKTPVF